MTKAVPPLLVLCLLAACQRPASEPAPGSKPARVALDFVGGDSCAACHELEAERWRGSHHDLAMQEATAASVLGDFDDAELTYAGVTSRFFRRDGGFYVRTDGPDGEPTDYRIAYTFGVEPLQQYLIELSHGRLQALSICWDSRPAAAGGQRWFHLYAGERVTHDDPLHWTGRLQNWNFMCAECHSTNLRKNFDPVARRYDTTWSEIDVSCEACHGPGSRHVAWAEAGQRGEPVDAQGDLGLAVILRDRDGAAWLMDPASGVARRSVPRTSQAQLETCARCHARRSVIAPDYEHGRPLADSHRPALLEEGLYHADGQILDEVYVYGSFLQSRMHAAGVTCGDCHDPHSAELTSGEADASCSRCHLADRFDSPEHHFHEPGSPGASCVECHMPSRLYMVVDDRRDHSFRIPRPGLSLALGVPNACNDCHRERSVEWAAAAAAEWYGAERVPPPAYPGALHAAWAGAVDAEARLIDALADPETPGIARASAAALLGGYLSRAALGALRQALRDEDPLVRAAAVASVESLAPEPEVGLLVPLLSDPVRLVRLTAARALAATQPGAMTPLERDARAAALEEYRQAQLANADRPEALANLGALEAALGNPGAAGAAFRQALEIDPGFVPAYVNLADVYRLEGRDAEGEDLLRAAVGLAPDAPAVRQALGLLLVRRQRTTEALAQLERAASLAPDEPRYAYVYGVALHSSGDGARAVAVLDAAHRRSPGDRALLQALATISRDLGETGKALAYARALAALSPDDPGVRQLVLQLERLAG